MTTDGPLTKCPVCEQSFPRSVKLCPNDGAVLEHDEGTGSHLGEVLDGKYRLDAFLSRGGMGAVYRATHVMLGRTVAVKLINPEYVTSTEAVRRFQREARAATSLNHPNIVSVYDLGQTPQGTLYIAMEFVDGPSLKSVIVSGGPLPPARTILLLRQVAGALAVAHRNNIVHRDLKPQNIMLTRAENGQEVVKLVDFGIAKTYDDGTQLTTSGATMGTPQYMSPEQASGTAVDGRSDLYSLGVVLYEMLSGDVPFNDKSATGIIIKHMRETPEPPSMRNPRVKVPPDLEAAALRCLEKDPAARFQTAEEFIATLDRASVGIAGAVSEMEATILTPRPITQATLPPPLVPEPAAPTVITSKQGPATAHTVAPATPVTPREPTVRVASDTRPTVARPVDSAARASDLVARAGIDTGLAAKPASKSNTLPVLILVVAILLAAVGGAVYYFQQGEEAITVSSSPPPTASPAMADQNQAQAAPTPAPGPSSAAAPPADTPAGASSATPATAGVAPDQPTGPPTSRGGRAAAAGAVVSAGQASATPGGAASRGSARGAAAGQALQSATRVDEPARQAQPASFPENPVVYFHCAGAPEICSALRTAVDEALDSGGLSAVRSAARADIDVAATVEGVQQNVSQQFGTTFAVRTYAIDVSAETTRTSEAVSMPPASNLSFDPQFGSARIAERARLVAADIVERVKAFAKKKRGG